jgi:predicted TIM-barrel fold metal-dependent hydrolase/predicted NBD/HSP70 family sugar kinase
MAEPRTLAVDIGGTGVKLAVLDGKGRIIGESVRVPTPMPPVAPEVLAAAIDKGAAALGGFDRASVGFPGMVRGGRVLTAPHLGTELWAKFDLQDALTKRWKKPVRVMNDADVQGFGAIAGKGVEMVLTLGTGAGTAIFDNGQIIPHLELAHHPVHGNRTYDEYLGNAALGHKGPRKWNKRVERVIEILRRLVNFDHLYIGGGNARHITFPLPSDVTIVPNSDGLTGGIALWRAEKDKSAGDRSPRIAKGRAGKRKRHAKSSASTPSARSVGETQKKSRAASPRTRNSAKTAVREADLSELPLHPRTMTASQPKAPVDFRVPADSCDCHVHVFGTAAEFPFAGSRGYTPPAASADELSSLLHALKLSRVVIVQPSVYGSDNSCTLDGMRRLGEQARGVAVIDDATTDEALANMHRAGIRGVRVNLETAGETDLGAARRNLAAAVARVAPLGWHVQVYTRLSVIAGLSEDLAQLPVPIVFDHFGGAQAAGGIDQPGFAALLGLVGGGQAYVKVSAAYRSSEKAPSYGDVAPLARALIKANPERIVWGTDWPHPHAASPSAAPEEPAPFYDIDDGLALNQLALWAPSAAIRRKILVDNPARLYGF